MALVVLAEKCESLPRYYITALPPWPFPCLSRGGQVVVIAAQEAAFSFTYAGRNATNGRKSPAAVGMQWIKYLMRQLRGGNGSTINEVDSTSCYVFSNSCY